MDVNLLKKWFKWSQVVLAMVLVQILLTGMQLLSKVILSQGTFIFALMAYRHIVAAICVAPFAFYLERNKEKKLNWSVWFWLFANALLGITGAVGLFYYGLRDTTPAYANGFLNLVPIGAFVLSLITRIEKLNLHTRAGKVKTLGVLICVGGALTASLYKGKAFHLRHDHGDHHPVSVKTSYAHWTRGTVMLIGSSFSLSAWFIVQTKLMKIFPLKYMTTMLMCLIATLQSTVIGLCLDRSPASWKLGWDLQLVTIIYSGALSTAVTFCLISWSISVQGPLYAPMFNPLSLIFVALTSALFLGEEITTGTLLGMVMIIVGLYSFLWAKRKQMKSSDLPHSQAPQVAKTDAKPTAQGSQSGRT